MALPQRNPIFLANDNISASSYVLKTFQRIPSASLQDALLVLSFSQIPALFTFLALWAQEERAIPLTCRVLLFMLKTHQKQLVASRQMKSVLEDVRGKLRTTLMRQKGEMGFNLAGLRVLGRRVRDVSGESEFVDEETWLKGERAQGKKGRKREFVNIA